MADHFLDSLVHELESSTEQPNMVAPIGHPWYNPDGDCVLFLTMDEAYIGERIDEYLTIFRHYETEMAIGFMVKGIRHILETFPVDGLCVDAEVSGDELRRVSLKMLLLITLNMKQGDNRRIQGYAEAIKPELEELDLCLN